MDPNPNHGHPSPRHLAGHLTELRPETLPAAADVNEGAGGGIQAVVANGRLRFPAAQRGVGGQQRSRVPEGRGWDGVRTNKGSPDTLPTRGRWGRGGEGGKGEGEEVGGGGMGGRIEVG